MRRRLHSLLVLGLALATALPLACGNKSDATYVLLRFEGSVPADAQVAAIVVSASLAGSSASATFTAPAGGSIVLPTTGYLEIGAGEGKLALHGVAQSVTGATLAEGDGEGTVSRGATATVMIKFFPTVDNPDAGLPGGPDKDAEVDVRTVPDLAKEKPIIQNTGGTIVGAGGNLPGTGGAPGTGGVVSGTGGGVEPGTGGTGQGGTRAAGKIESAPGGVTFLAVPVGTNSGPQTVTLTNVGNGPVGPLGVSTQDPAQFPIDSDGCSGVTLKPAASCSLAVSFRPASTATQVSNLVVSAPGAPQLLQVPMTGSGMNQISSIDIAPNSYDFGGLEIGSLGSTAVFTIRNTGNVSTNINGLNLAAPSPAYQVLNDTCTNTSLKPAGTCIFTLQFKPASPGNYLNTLNVRASNGVGISISIRGLAKQTATVVIQLTGPGKGGIQGQGVACAEGTCKVSVEIVDATTVPSIALQAVPQPNSVFAGWGGGPCGSQPSCTLNVSGSMSLTAQFDLRQFQLGLKVIEANGGTGTLSLPDGSLFCPQTCGPITRPVGSMVVVNAKPSATSVFTGWIEGPCKGATGPQCQFNLAGDTVVAGSFGPQN
jgi:hypothetical protein